LGKHEKKVKGFGIMEVGRKTRHPSLFLLIFGLGVLLATPVVLAAGNVLEDIMQQSAIAGS
jgi:hypothetical protein